MTREEAIKVFMVEAHGLAEEAKQMAIQALSQEPTVQDKQAESEKYQKAYDDGYANGYAQARFDYEQKPCGDAVSREAVLSLWGLRLSDKEIYMAIHDMPSVTPKSIECDGVVSRQAVLDLVADYDLSMGEVVKGIHDLPPVTSKSIECDDAINRQNIIDTYKSCADMLSDEELKGADLVMEWVKNAPSVTQKPIECKDVVSREDAIRTLRADTLFVCTGDKMQAISDIEGLLPVTQKSSKDMPCITSEEMQKCKDMVKKYTPIKEDKEQTDETDD